ncbi:MAG: hypothetical protein LBP56_00195 [Odoribacteraceae bacterium]|jgi:hypothetical protein|nr:hypothetical protein [Odoribacteraceae bacterium]
MKKVALTIKTEKTYHIEFNEEILDEEVIENFNEYMFEIKQMPEDDNYRRPFMDKFLPLHGITESDYPYLNLAKHVALQASMDNLEYLELLPKAQYVTKEADEEVGFLVSRYPNTGIFVEKIDEDVEFDFDFDNINV